VHAPLCLRLIANKSLSCCCCSSSSSSAFGLRLVSLHTRCVCLIANKAPPLLLLLDHHCRRRPWNPAKSWKRKKLLEGGGSTCMSHRDKRPCMKKRALWKKRRGGST